MERRIAICHTQVNFVDDLVARVPGEEYPLFETKQKALMFAAALGFHLQRRVPLTARDASSAIRFDIFQKNIDDGFVACAAIATAGELGVLVGSREDEIGVLFEEYANAGLAELHLRVWGKPEPLQGLIALMNDARFLVIDQGLEGVDSGVLADLLKR